MHVLRMESATANFGGPSMTLDTPKYTGTSSPDYTHSCAHHSASHQRSHRNRLCNTIIIPAPPPLTPYTTPPKAHLSCHPSTPTPQHPNLPLLLVRASHLLKPTLLLLIAQTCISLAPDAVQCGAVRCSAVAILPLHVFPTAACHHRRRCSPRAAAAAPLLLA